MPDESSGRRELKSGDTLKKGEYIIKECIGHGGSSLIYRAETKKGDKVIIKEVYPVAYGRKDAYTRDGKNGDVVPQGEFEREEAFGSEKVTRAELCEYLRRTIKNAQRETDIIKTIKQKEKSFPYLAKFEEPFKESRTYYFVVEDIDLQKLEKKMDPEDALRYTLRILQPLNMLHDCGFLHLDIKPDNIMATPHDLGDDAPLLYLIDFNSCVEIGEELTQDKISRTVTYAAPELNWANEGNFEFAEIGRHTDIYSVGIVLLRLLTADYLTDDDFGRFVRGEISKDKEICLSDGNLTDGIINQFPELAAKIKKEHSHYVLEKINAILKKALFKTIYFRYQDCGEMMADIKSADEMIKHREIIIPQYFEAHYERISKDLPEDDFGVRLEKNTTIAKAIKKLPNGKNLLVTGEGGSGKSTLLKKFVASFANAPESKAGRTDIAIYVPLNNVESSIEDFIETNIFADFDVDWKAHCLDKTILLLLDGYNEVSPHMRERLSKQIASLRETTFPNCKIVLASRGDPGFANFEKDRISRLTKFQVLEALSAHNVSIGLKGRLLSVLLNARLLEMFLKSEKLRFIENEDKMANWPAKEIAKDVELLRNFYLYDFLEKSQTRTEEERAVLFLCIRFFVPAIAFGMALKNAPDMYHGGVDCVQICENTLEWLGKNPKLPAIKGHNVFAYGRIKAIIESLDIEKVLKPIKDELQTLEDGLHKLNRDFLAAMHLRNLMFIDTLTEDIDASAKDAKLLSALSDSFSAKVDWEEKDELHLLRHIFLYDIEAKCEIPKARRRIIIGGGGDAKMEFGDIAEQMRESLNAYAANLRQALSGADGEETLPIAQIKDQLEYFHSAYPDDCGEAFLWWLLGINEAENDVSFSELYTGTKYRDIHSDVCRERFSGKEFAKIPSILSPLLAREGKESFVKIKNENDKGEGMLDRWISVISRRVAVGVMAIILLSVLIVASLFFPSLRATSPTSIDTAATIASDEIRIFGISVQKEDDSAELSETDLRNVELAVFENLDALRDKEPKDISLVSLLEERFVEKLLFALLLVYELLLIIFLLGVNNKRRRYSEKFKKSGEKIPREIYLKILSSAFMGVAILFILVGWARPSVPPIVANATARLFNGRPALDVLQTGSQNLFRLRNDIVTTGYWQTLGGDRYEGEFAGNSITGSGIYTTSDGEVREGTFVFGKMYGNGTVTDKDKNKFAGEFLGDMLHGQVKVTSADGAVLFEGEIIDKPATMETVWELLVEEQ